MRSKDASTILLSSIIILMIIGYIIYQSVFSKTSFWDINLERDSKKPYDVSLFYETMEASTSISHLTTSISKINLDNKFSVLFVNKKFYADSVESEEIINFISEGNKFYIFSNSISDDFNRKLSDIVDGFVHSIGYVNSTLDSTLLLSINGKDLTSYTYFNELYERTRFSYFSNYLDSSNQKIKPILYNEKKDLIGIEIKIGEGSLYWILNPIILSNFYFKEKEKYLFTKKLIQKIDLNQNSVIWDDYHSIQRKIYSDAKQKRNAPLDYIFSQKSLTWAWYVLLLGTLTYFSFNTKRKVPATPVFSKKKNTSLRYINLLSELYFQNQSHKDLVWLKLNQFKLFVKTHYGIDIIWGENSTDLAKLSLKSGIKREVINPIFESGHKVQKLKKINDETVLEIHNQLDLFYKYCKH